MSEQTSRDQRQTQSEQRRSAFPDQGEGQLGAPVVDESVRDGLDNAVENSAVRTRATESETNR